jgi:integrase
MAGMCVMNTSTTMQSHAENYLNERRRLGFGLRSSGYSIKSFARYFDDLGYQRAPTIEIMADWARLNKGNSNNPAIWARRLKKLRSFVNYLQQFYSRIEVPDDSTFGQTGQRLAPHIYNEQEIIDLLAAARRLGPSPGVRGATYETLFGLIASTGLRVSEAVHLMDADVDLKWGMLTIRQTKFAKSRQVPLHPSTIEALKRYRYLRNGHVVVTEETPFFISTRGKRRGCSLSLRQVHRVFIGLRDDLEWRNRGAHDGPRIHDLRYTFVVRRVMLWHTQGKNIEQAMLALSTYVGHAKITNTYWYLTGVPELMALAAEKFESYAEALEVCHE